MTDKMSTFMKSPHESSCDSDNELWGEMMGVTSRNETLRLEALGRARLDQIGKSKDMDNMLIMYGTRQHRAELLHTTAHRLSARPPAA